MGGLKNNWFFLNRSRPFVWLGHVASGGAGAKKAFMMSRRLWVFPGSMSFQWWRSCSFGFPRGCPPINSILCLLLHFSYCIFSESFCFFFLLCSSLLFLSEKTLEFFLSMLLCRNSNLSSPHFHLVRAFLFLFSLCCACLFIGFVSDLFGPVACYCVLNVWYLLVFWDFLRVFLTVFG